MQTKLHLKYWKNKVLLITVFFFILYPFESKSQIELRIDLENVRHEIIKKGGYLFPDEYLRELDTNLFNVIYIDDYCIIHISYKNRSTFSSDKFSYVIIYQNENNNWIMKNSFPYYYKLRLLDSSKRLFISENKICGMDGECSTFIEISKFQNDDLIRLKEFTGFNKVLFYDRFLVNEDFEIVKNAISDTIAQDIKIVGFNLNLDSTNSCTIEQTNIILIDYRDTLITKEIKTTKELKF